MHVAVHSRLVLLGGDFQCYPGWSLACVSVRTRIALVLLEFLAPMHLHRFIRGMQGPTSVSAHAFIGALHFFLRRRASPEVGVVHVENDTIFPSDQYSVGLRLLTFPALTAPGNPIALAHLKMCSCVSSHNNKFLRTTVKVRSPCPQPPFRKRIVTLLLS